MNKTNEQEVPKEPTEPYKCVISFDIMFKIDGSDEVQVRRKTVTGRHHQKKTAKKVAWIIVIQETYKTLFALDQSKLILTKN